jgi:hypothetical protein
MGKRTQILLASCIAINAQDAPYVNMSSFFEILLESLGLAIEAQVLCLSCLDVICSSTLLVRVTSLLLFFYIIIMYMPFIWIKSYGNLFIYSRQHEMDVPLFGCSIDRS